MRNTMIRYLSVFTVLILSGCNYFNQTPIHCESMVELSQLEKCAQSGETYSQYNLGARYMNGIEAPIDLEKAFYWTKLAADKGYPFAESNLGWLYYKGWGVPKDDKKAFEWTIKSAKQGHIPAYVNLGFLYSHGIGTPVNWKKGVEYYQLAADADIAEAYQNLGIAYRYGKGVRQDTQKALEMTKRAVERGSQAAIYNLSGIYSSMGKSKEANLMLRKAAELNIVFAQADLAAELAEIAKTEVDKQEAKQWLERALAQNDPYAYTVAGMLYAEKNNVFPINEKKAYEFYMKAAELEKNKPKLSWHCGIGKEDMYQKTK